MPQQDRSGNVCPLGRAASRSLAVGRRILPYALSIVILVAPVALADVCYFGYSDAITGLTRLPGGTLTYYSWLYQQKEFYGIDVEIGLVGFRDDYTILRDAFPAVVSTFADADTKMVIDMGWLLFETYSASSYDCSEYEGSATEAPSVQGKFRLRSNWKARLDDFTNSKGYLITPDNTAILALHTEVNNSCIPRWQMNTAGSAVKARFPGIPVAAGYGLRQNTSLGQIHQFEKGLPASFPRDVDLVAFWSYGVFDPRNPGHSKNTQTVTFFNPSNGADPTTLWGDFKKRLKTYHKVVHVVEAFYFTNNPNPGWTQADVGTSATNWNAWAKTQNRLVGQIAAGWLGGGTRLGTQDLPLSVKQAHAGIASSTSVCP